MSSEGVWSAQDTSPAAVEAALRKLLAERHEESDAYVPARVLNLIAIVDRDWKGEIQNRLERCRALPRLADRAVRVRERADARSTPTRR